jgi:hypothetical protein
VQVLHDQHCRPLLGQPLNQPPPGRKRLPSTVTTKLRTSRQADERPQMSTHPGSLIRVGEQAGYSAGELGLGLLGRVGVQDAGLGLDHLPECPQRNPLPIGQAAALPPGDELGFGLHQLPQLPHQATLADPWHPHQSDQLEGLLVPRPP